MPFELLNLDNLPTAVVLVFIWMLYRDVNDMKGTVKDLDKKLDEQSHVIYQLKGEVQSERR